MTQMKPNILCVMGAPNQSQKKTHKIRPTTRYTKSICWKVNPRITVKARVYGAIHEHSIAKLRPTHPQTHHQNPNEVQTPKRHITHVLTPKLKKTRP
jgi:hypothetical protein